MKNILENVPVVSALFKVSAVITGVFKVLRRIKVQTHLAYHSNNDRCLQVNIQNRSLDREVEITHVWIEGIGKTHVLNPQRSLPVSIRPGKSWETWISLSNFKSPDVDVLLKSARVRLSDGTVLKSKANPDVPDVGSVPG